MNHPNHGHLPIHGDNNRQQPYYHRTHTVRYYAHRVKESLSTRVSKFICTIFLFIFFIAGLIAFIIWLGLRPHRPRFHIQEFSIPALAQAQQSAPPESVAVNFNVTIRNPNHKVTVHYDSIECAVFYKEQQIGGIPLVTSEFDQESKSTVILQTGLGGPTLTAKIQRWAEMQKDLTAGFVPFRLQITSVFKFEILSWGTKSKTHKMHANCVAQVGPNGLLLPHLVGTKCPVYFT
ncbi:protein NDR1-like [Chenopodium quinoa]|uniref:protein NDR1-like n=1 Tax=Chenopodium quinoa TaxID=63459 RepID=UPI000B77B2C8|nr:protein NDR1-like [Chenopodium quinoa]